MNTESLRRPFLHGAGLAAIAAAIIATPLPAAAAVIWPQNLSVAVSDTVRGATENVVFSGQLMVVGRVVKDTNLSGPRVMELIIDFSGVSGTGATTGKKYVTAAHVILHRSLKALDPVQVSFPYYSDGQLTAARTALASLAVSYAPASGIAIVPKLTAPVF